MSRYHIGMDVAKGTPGPTKNQICAAIRGLRRALGLNQFELADKLSVSPRTIARWEGEQPPDKALHVLAEFAATQNQDQAAQLFRSALRERAIHDLGKWCATAQQSSLPLDLVEVPNLSQAVRGLRLMLGWTQQDLANALGKATQTIGRWESEGPRGMALYELRDLAAKKQLWDLSASFAQAFRQEFPGSEVPSEEQLDDALQGRYGQSMMILEDASSRPWVEALLYLLKTPTDPSHQGLLTELLRTYMNTVLQKHELRNPVHQGRLIVLLRLLDNDEEARRLLEPTQANEPTKSAPTGEDQ